jgi:regulator of protease activity HflC (stomatin/prohibitin superfamily)
MTSQNDDDKAGPWGGGGRAAKQQVQAPAGSVLNRWRGKMNSTIRLIGAAFVVVVIVAAAFDGFYTIDQGELGVQLRNGAVTGVAEPGFHMQVPLIDSVKEISIRTEKLDYDDVASYSKDIQAADINVVVTYRADPSRVADVYSEYGSVHAMADRIVTPAIYGETKIVFGTFVASAAIAERARLVAEIEAAVRRKVEGTPLILENVQIANIDFSKAFEQSVEERMLAEVEVTKLKQNLEREKVEADIVRTQAAAQADRVRAEAQANADAIRLTGEAEAAAITARGAALRDNPALIQLVQAERWNGVLPSTMLPSGTVPFIDVLEASGQ